jgi:hypothetical protein
MPIRFKNGGEQDALTKARKVYCYTGRAGVCKKIKRKYNRRVRRKTKQVKP